MTNISNEHDEQEGKPRVEVLNLKTNRDVKFHASWTDTLQTVWNTAYDKLGEARQEGDKFECQDGNSLTDHLGKTLEQLREQKICKDRKFQIRGPAGGA